MADHVDAAFGEVCDVLGFKTLNEHQKKRSEIRCWEEERWFCWSAVIFQTLPLLYACEQMCGTKLRKNLVILLEYCCFSPGKPGEGPSQPVVFSGHKCHTAIQRNVRSKVESGQYSIVYGHRSRGWRHTMARGNAHKLSETYKNSVRRCWWSVRCLSLENSVRLVAKRRQRLCEQLWKSIMKIMYSLSCLPSLTSNSRFS